MQTLYWTSDHIVSSSTLTFLEPHCLCTAIKMSKIESVLTDKAPKPLPQFSQAIKYNGLVYCSGNIGLDPATFTAVGGTVKDRTVCLPLPLQCQREPKANGHYRGKP